MTNDHSEPAIVETDESPGQLRSPLLEDGQPSFHWWLLTPGIVLALLWASYQGVATDEGVSNVFPQQLLWPGIAIWFITTGATYFGWRMDLD
jgi:hypothetical protein